MSHQDFPCLDGRHGGQIRSRTDGSKICFRCGQEWPGSDKELTVELSVTGILPTMDEQERMGFPGLLMPPATDEELEFE